ncbi:MAG: GNAT family N-acetyltransferase [Ruminococcus sp.]|nr:GNAT family N-acetyltransferase [Ruminococcus sp.]
MSFIRPARAEDAPRIAEIYVINYRDNFYRFFHNDEYYFKELLVTEVAKEYSEGSQALGCCYVYDDGVIKGFIRVNGREIEKLFVEKHFQSRGVGAALLDYAVKDLSASMLWVLEFNERGIQFYRRHGFELTGEKMVEDEWVPLLKMERRGN